MAELDAADLRWAIERLGAFFAERQTRQGLLARERLAQLAPDDDALRTRIIEQLRRDTRTDGSVGGAVLPTAWRANELLDLGHAGDEPGTARAMQWLFTWQGKPGAYSDGCTPERHQRRACEHFLSGFFAAAAPEQRVAPVTFPTGKVFRGEPPARFAVSCLALRAALRAGHERRPLVEQHVAGLLRLHETFEQWGSYFPPDLLASAVGALAFAGAKHRSALARFTGLLADHQEPDGTWADADLFHMLEALVLTRTDQARRALRRAAPALVERQRDDGSFGPTAREERAWIALRALLTAAEDELAPVGP